MTKALELAELGQFLAVDANGDITFNKDLDVDTITSGNVDITGNITVTGNVDGRDLSTDGTKLDSIESNATADQSDAEIKTAYENNSDTNALTDANLTKLNGIEALADVTDATNVASAGALMSANNLSDLASATTARTNLDVDQAGEALAFSIALG
jgi:hypothetical protein